MSTQILYTLFEYKSRNKIILTVICIYSNLIMYNVFVILFYMFMSNGET